MSKNLIDISRRQADQLVQQAEFSRELFNKMIEHDKKMGEHDNKMKSFENKMLESEYKLDNRFEELEKNYTLTHGESKYIKSKVAERSYYLANRFFEEDVSKEMYHKKRCHFIQGLYGALNRHFDAIAYTTIKHIDFQDAMRFVERLELTDLPPHFLRLTDKQKEIAEKHGDYNLLERLT